MDIVDLSARVQQAERRALARAITLVESQRADHRALSEALLVALAKSGRQSLRIGLSGTPGVGKSTFIEALGLQLIAKGLRVAVLAVDPSSTRSGGSILGDKTRMERLSQSEHAYIRPSPNQNHLGGIARRTREATQICEAAGFDVVLIETVGVGQSEIAVSHLSDIFLLLLAPAGGDELQGVKRGIMEIADIVLINKADGELKSAASRSCADYASALRLLGQRTQDPEGFPKAATVSALEKKGLDAVWQDICDLAQWRRANGHWEQTRQQQAGYWVREDVEQGMLARLETPWVAAELARLSKDVAQGEISVTAAAQQVLRGLGV